MSVRMPALLNKGTLAQEDRFHPVSLGLDVVMNEISTASMVLEPGDIELAGREWVRLYSTQGDMGVFRVSSVDHRYTDGGAREVKLSHLLDSLNDDMIFDEWNVGSTSNTVTPTYAITQILSKQTTRIWQLGTCEFTERDNYSFEGETLLEALQTVLDSLEDDYLLTYEMDSLPFTLNVVAISSQPSCEMRNGHNLSSIRRTVDASRIITRLYPYGYQNLSLASPKYIQNDTAIARYGVICGTISNEAMQKRSQLLKWATRQLAQLSEPTVSLEITGLELTQATGESWDSLVVGKRCRVPLPEYSITVTDVIRQISWADLMRQPEAVTISLSTPRKTFSAAVHSTSRSAATKSSTHGSGRATRHAINSIMTMDSSKTWVDGQVHDIGDVMEEVIGGTALWQTRDNIATVAGKFTVDSNGKLHVINGSALYIGEGSASLAVYKDGDIDAGFIVNTLNDGTTEARIKASVINLDGYVTTTALSSVNAKIDNLMTGVTTATAISTTSFYYSGRKIVTRAVYDVNGNAQTVLAYGPTDN